MTGQSVVTGQPMALQQNNQYNQHNHAQFNRQNVFHVDARQISIQPGMSHEEHVAHIWHIREELLAQWNGDRQQVIAYAKNLHEAARKQWEMNAKAYAKAVQDDAVRQATTEAARMKSILEQQWEILRNEASSYQMTAEAKVAELQGAVAANGVHIASLSTERAGVDERLSSINDQLRLAQDEAARHKARADELYGHHESLGQQYSVKEGEPARLMAQVAQMDQDRLRLEHEVENAKL